MRSNKSLIFFLVLLFCQLSVSGYQKEIVRLKELLNDGASEVEKAEIYARMGMIYTERSLDSSFYYGSLAMDLSRKIKDQKNEARAMSVLAFCYMETGNNYLAYKFANEALVIFKQLNLSEQVAEMTMNIGVLLLKEGKVGQGIEQIELAYRQSQKLERDSIQALIILNMIIPKQHQLPDFEIERYYEKANRIAQKYKDERTQILVKHVRAAMMFRNGTAQDQTRSAHEEVLQESREKGYDYLTIISLMELSSTYINENLDTALSYINAAVDMSEELGYEVLHYNLLQHTVQILRTLDATPEEINPYLDRIEKLNELRASEDQKAGLGFLELAIKEQDLQVEQAKLQIRRMWSIVIAVAGGLSLLMVVWLLWQAKIKRRLLQNLEKTSGEVAEKNLQLEQNDRFNTRLISILSHDLRQPFSSILMMSNDLLSELTPDEQQVVYRNIRRSASISLQVMDGLLYWTKLQTAGLAETPTPVGIRTSFGKALTFYEYDIENADLTVTLRIDEELSVLGQSEMLLFVNRNLISNAIKYSPSGGIITAEAKVDADRGRVLVEVSDTGPGIDEKILKTLFQKQHGNSQEVARRSKEGAGLALIICHEMIEKMDGRIWAENNAEGSGAVFYYELPLASSTTIREYQKAVEFQ